MLNKNPKTLKLFSFSLLSSSALVAGTLMFLAPPANSVQFSNGEVAFNSPPRLVNDAVSLNGRDIPATTLYLEHKATRRTLGRKNRFVAREPDILEKSVANQFHQGA